MSNTNGLQRAIVCWPFNARSLLPCHAGGRLQGDILGQLTYYERLKTAGWLDDLASVETSAKRGFKSKKRIGHD